MANFTDNTTALQSVLDAIENMMTVDDITPESIGAAPSTHSQAASTITAGTFAGAVVAQTTSQTPGTSLLRNSKIVASDTTPSNNGEICWTYE